jgi:hypothetical protein
MTTPSSPDHGVAEDAEEAAVQAEADADQRVRATAEDTFTVTEQDLDASAH